VFGPRSEEEQSIIDVLASAASHVSSRENVFRFYPMDHSLIENLFKEFPQCAQECNWAISVWIAIVGFPSFADNSSSCCFPFSRKKALSEASVEKGDEKRREFRFAHAKQLIWDGIGSNRLLGGEGINSAMQFS
jgi:hypothetical protein